MGVCVVLINRSINSVSELGLVCVRVRSGGVAEASGESPTLSILPLSCALILSHQHERQSIESIDPWSLAIDDLSSSS
jgi:hypothetical protein